MIPKQDTDITKKMTNIFYEYRCPNSQLNTTKIQQHIKRTMYHNHRESILGILADLAYENQ